MLRFDWDERKNKGNRARHGVWFEEALSVFHDPHARLFHDPEHSEDEDRFSGKNTGRRSLLQGIRFLGSDHFCPESNQEGGPIL
jgi:uncharacterized DUF497 family protein